MSWIVSNIRWIMIVSGALTATMVYAAISPRAMLQSTFGETLEGPLAEIVVRNWGALIALGGVMLIYAASRPALRVLALAFTGAGKAIFVALVLAQAGRYLGRQVAVAVVTDSVMVLLFVWYLVAARHVRDV
jgi:hypothetical protein